MKKIKLKNSYSHRQKYLIVSALLTLLATYLMTTFIVKNISSNLEDYIASLVKRQNTIYLKDAFSKVVLDDPSFTSLLNVIKNSKDEITEVDFDIKTSTELLSQVTTYLNDHIDSYNYLGYRIDVPIGIISQNPILVNVGPKIPIKVELSDVALGNVRTSVKSFGINNALVEVYLDIFIKSQVIYPFAVVDADSSFSSLIASKIISGTVPNFFGGALTSQSETINVPLTR